MPATDSLSVPPSNIVSPAPVIAGDHQRTVLDNGIRVITSHMPHTNAVSTVLLVGAGSRFETDAEAGVSHLFEHMLFKGTHARPKPRDISGEIESVGGMLNAFTDREFTGYWCKMPLPHYQAGINVLADIVQHPLFRERDITQEKHVVLEEIHAAQDSPSALTAMLLDATIWPDQPLGREVAGTEATVNSITRDQMLLYHEQQYVGNNIILSVAGNVQHDDIVAQASDALGDLKPGTPRDMFPYQDNLRGPAVMSQHTDFEQLHIALAFHGVNVCDPRRHALRLMSIVLGGSMSSRLFEEVRENRGLVYSIGSAAMSMSDCGVLDIDTAVEVGLAEEAMEVIVHELRKMRDGVTDQELHDARELAKGRLMLGMEDSRSVANSLASQELQQGHIATLQERIELYDAVTQDDVRSVANEIIDPKHLAVALVGPIEHASPYEEIVRF